MAEKNPREYWDRQASIYALSEGQPRYGRFLKLYEESCWRYISAVLPKPEEALILEAGCGTGRWVVRLAPLGYRMVLSDLSTEMLKYAREKVARLGLDDRVLAYHALDICNMSALTDQRFDLVLALGGLLTLCHDAEKAVREFFRLTSPGGYVICDAANRYRTALDLVRDGKTEQLLKILDTGDFDRPDGLSDHRFGPQELADLFTNSRWNVQRLVGICPFFAFLPGKESVSALDDEGLYSSMLEVAQRHAETSALVSLSGRLLVVACKPGSELSQGGSRDPAVL